MTDTWNAGGTTFNGIYMNISNGAGGAPVGAAASRAFKLDANSSEIFSIDISGKLLLGGSSAPLPALSVNGSNLQVIAQNGVFTCDLVTRHIELLSTGIYKFSPGADPTSAADTGISRLAANSVAVGNGTAADATGTINVGALRINQAASSIGTGVKTISNAADSNINFGKYFSFNLNGTTVYVPCSTVAPT